MITIRDVSVDYFWAAELFLESMRRPKLDWSQWHGTL